MLHSSTFWVPDLAIIEPVPVLASVMVAQQLAHVLLQSLHPAHSSSPPLTLQNKN